MCCQYMLYLLVDVDGSSQFSADSQPKSDLACKETSTSHQLSLTNLRDKIA